MVRGWDHKDVFLACARILGSVSEFEAAASSYEERSVSSWPDAWRVLDADLRAGRGTPALVEAGATGAEVLLAALSAVVDHVVSIGQRLSQHEGMPPIADLMDDISGSTLLRDIDVLFSPALKLDVLSQLRRMVRNRSLVVLWPGRIHAGRLSYSSPGRSDFVDFAARDVIVLHPAATHFPDEVPYLLERFPA